MGDVIAIAVGRRRRVELARLLRGPGVCTCARPAAPTRAGVLPRA